MENKNKDLEKVFDLCKKNFKEKNKKSQRQKTSSSRILKQSVIEDDLEQLQECLEKMGSKKIKSILSRNYSKLNYSIRENNILGFSVQNKSLKVLPFLVNLYSQHFSLEEMNNIFEKAWQSCLEVNDRKVFNVLKENIENDFKENLNCFIAEKNNESGNPLLSIFYSMISNNGLIWRPAYRRKPPINIIQEIIFNENINVLDSKKVFLDSGIRIKEEDINETQFDKLYDVFMLMSGGLKDSFDKSMYLEDFQKFFDKLIITIFEVNSSDEFYKTKEAIFNKILFNDIKTDLERTRVSSFYCNNKSYFEYREENYNFLNFLSAFSDILIKNDFLFNSDSFFSNISFKKENLPENIKNTLSDKMPLSFYFDLVGKEERRDVLLESDFLKEQFLDYQTRFPELYVIASSNSAIKFFSDRKDIRSNFDYISLAFNSQNKYSFEDFVEKTLYKVLEGNILKKIISCNPELLFQSFPEGLAEEPLINKLLRKNENLLNNDNLSQKESVFLNEIQSSLDKCKIEKDMKTKENPKNKRRNAL